jgi:predicted ATP-dependent endonuclease of OLD family
MYIKQLKIKNIRSISDFEMKFPNPAGWHVLIGDNGAGKSTIVRAVAAALIGPYEIPAARLIWKDWLRKGEDEGELKLEIYQNKEYDKADSNYKSPNIDLIENRFIISKRNDKKVGVAHREGGRRDNDKVSTALNWGDDTKGWFSAAYGPFRRFTGGDESKNVIFEASPKVGAHLSVFGEDVALTEALEWLRELNGTTLTRVINRESKSLKKTEKHLESLYNLINHFKANEALKPNIAEMEDMMLNYRKSIDALIPENDTEDIKEEVSLLFYLKSFLNKSNLLPHNTKFEGFDVDGNIIFKDGRGNTIPVVEMSDGYRSILSLLFDLIRQLIRVYGEDVVLENIKKGEMNIPVPGVVLIDEVDAHLHPTWQVRIGEWFTKYFPQIQFIVTTHSPLVCRAAKKGSIWQLAAPVNGGTHKEITGLEKERLIYGNILDAYGTELFGASPVRSVESDKMKARLGKLNTMFAIGKISKEEETERQGLLKILSTDDPTGF